MHLAEERQDQNAKRRKLERQNNSGESMKLSGASYVAVPSSVATPANIHPTLPQRPAFDLVVPGALPASSSSPTTPDKALLAKGSKAMSGSNHDIVANRHAIRMANMSAAEMLRAEMSSLMPVKNGPRQEPSTTAFVLDSEDSDIPGLSMSSSNVDYTATPSVSIAPQASTPPAVSAESVSVPSDELSALPTSMPLSREATQESIDMSLSSGNGSLADITMVSADDSVANATLVSVTGTNSSNSPRGTKRKMEEVAPDSEEDAVGEDEADASSTPAVAVRRVNPDGTVVQEDTVRFAYSPLFHFSCATPLTGTFIPGSGNQAIESDTIARNSASSSVMRSSESSTYAFPIWETRGSPA